MHAGRTDMDETLARLEALMCAPRLAGAEADRCARLLDALRTPARVCLMGPVQSDLRTILYSILDIDFAPDGLALPPAIEIRHGPVIRTQATLEDGQLKSSDGWPSVALLSDAPVFLQIDAPAEILRRMSILALTLEADPAMHRPALSWAARRTEIAVWCTPSFGAVDAGIWANAPERLTHRAYLLETRPEDERCDAGPASGFTTVLHIPLPGDIAPLLSQLDADIDEALLADMDAAQMVLHRLGPLVTDLPDAPLPNGPVPANCSAAQLDYLSEILSEPTLFLSRRARSLAEDLTWAAVEEPKAWAEAALGHCAETAEGLRDRASGWPDDLPELEALSLMIEEAADQIVLLQMETGAEQVEDAAGLLHQMRVAFDQCHRGMGMAA